MIVREQIAELVRIALIAAQEADELPTVEVEDIAVERPQNVEHGDFATSLPLKLARPMRMNPAADWQSGWQRICRILIRRSIAGVGGGRSAGFHKLHRQAFVASAASGGQLQARGNGVRNMTWAVVKGCRLSL